MAFEPGKSGNPEGGRGRKVFVDALHAIITQPSAGEVPPLPAKPTVAHVMAQRLVKEAVGNATNPKTALAFIQEICDRAYGRPKQALVGGDDDDKPIELRMQRHYTDEDLTALGFMRIEKSAKPPRKGA